MVYTGTHDNDTSRGWYENRAAEKERDNFRQYLRADGHDPAWNLIDAAWRSVAGMALAPLQDVLDLGSHARMNLPGSAQGNWSWRFTPDQITDFIEARLRDTTTIYGRDPQIYAGKEDEAGGQ
ncbi:MAG: 4-alpha-glucanotransferase [Caldilineaceae bacterium]